MCACAAQGSSSLDAPPVRRRLLVRGECGAPTFEGVGWINGGREARRATWNIAMSWLDATVEFTSQLSLNWRIVLGQIASYRRPVSTIRPADHFFPVGGAVATTAIVDQHAASS